MTDIFISYARSDKEVASRLADGFKGTGWTVWWDERIQPGEFFPAVIDSALQKARCVIALWSKTSVDSIWVRTEAAEGLKRKILIPVKIENVLPPLEFRSIQTIDLIDWRSEDPHHGYSKLVGAITTLLSGPSAQDQRESLSDLVALSRAEPSQNDRQQEMPSRFPLSKKGRLWRSLRIFVAVFILSVLAAVAALWLHKLGVLSVDTLAPDPSPSSLRPENTR